MKGATTKRRGFTLIEAIVTIAIIGVLASVVAVFIRMPMQNYADTAARAEMSDVADLALRRIARDLRSALPNSIRVIGDGYAIEFLATKTGGRYLAASDGDADGANRIALDFISSSQKMFTVVAPAPSFVSRAAVNDFIVVYNLGTGFDPANAWKGGNVAQIQQFDSARSLITMRSNPFGGQVPAMQSPNQRFQVVSGPVSYYCGTENGVLTLRRYWGYTINANPSSSPPSGASSAIAASRLSTCSGLFSYEGSLAAGDAGAYRRTGLATLAMSLMPRNATAAAVRLVYQIHVDNTP